jgi:hypothetical protein
MLKTRPQFTPEFIFDQIHKSFLKSAGEEGKTGTGISITDCVMSGFAVFSLKYPSLLRFDQHHQHQKIKENLKNLYHIQRVPSDTYMRERLDGLDVGWIQTAMDMIFKSLQRSKTLLDWRFLGGYYLISVDGTGFYSSSQIFCKQCSTTVHHKGEENEQVIYSHKMVVGSLVHPHIRQVLPILFEPSAPKDGSGKNDCERHMTKRFFKKFHDIHPFMNAVFLADGLHSNASFIEQMEAYHYHYICTAKQADHKALYEYFWAGEGPDITEFTDTSQGVVRKYRFMDNVPLNDSHLDLLVTVVYFEETDKNGQTTSWGWVTDLKVTKNNVRRFVNGARSRFKIENETYNTLKNQSYNLEHNYGHGQKMLCNFFAGLMLLAFLVDQVMEFCNKEFQACLEKCVSRLNLWGRITAFFLTFQIQSWSKVYQAILDPPFPVL